eukprot:COSAG02_NODE_4574_length_5204_cov_6.356709_1_plen_56_part_10
MNTGLINTVQCRILPSYSYSCSCSLLQVQTVLPFRQHVHVLETAKRPFPLVRLGLR